MGVLYKTDERTRREWLLGLLLVIAVLIAYGPALPAGYIWDDDMYLTENPLLTASDGLRRIWLTFESPSQYFPLTYTSFYLERSLWGLNPAGYHLVNIMLHAANALLVWLLLRRLRAPGAWLAAALFALHPVQVESVAWISERKNVLMGLFFLLSLVAWTKFLEERCERPWRFYGLALLFYALSLLAKTTACTLPAALLLILWLQKKPINGRRLAQVAPFVAMGIVMALVAMRWERDHHDVVGKSFDIGPVERVLIASRALWFYLGKLIWPVNLTVDYPRWNISASDPRAYGWVLATAAVGMAIWWARRWTGRSAEVAALFFAATLSPMLGFVMHGMFVYSFVADHFQYLACIGPIALAAAGIKIGLDRIAARKRFVQPIVCAVLLLTLTALTWQQCGAYASPETLWQRTLEINPDSWVAEGSLGTAAFKDGQMDVAIARFQKALKINPSFAQLHYNLGVCFFQLDRMDEAILEFQREIDLYPENVEAHNNLGHALSKKGKTDQAIVEFQQALALEPDMPSAQDGLGSALLLKGKVDEAIAHLQKAEQIEPRYMGEQNSLGIAFAEKGELNEAITHFEKALEIYSGDPEAAGNLAWLLATAPEPSLRNGTKALALAQQAIQPSTGANLNALQSLAAAYAENGNHNQAIAVAQRGLDLAVKLKNEPLARILRIEVGLYQSGRPERDAISHRIW